MRAAPYGRVLLLQQNDQAGSLSQVDFDWNLTEKHVEPLCLLKGHEFLQASEQNYFVMMKVWKGSQFAKSVQNEFWWRRVTRSCATRLQDDDPVTQNHQNLRCTLLFNLQSTALKF
jgi:hypothetical protein